MPVIVLYTKYTRLDRAAFTKSRTRGTRHGKEESGWQHACAQCLRSSAGPSLATRNTSVLMHPIFGHSKPTHYSGPSSNAAGPSRAIDGETQLNADVPARDAVSRARTRSTWHRAACVTRLVHIAFLFPQGVDHIPSASRGDYANTP